MFFSFISVAAPTFTTTTPPEKLARRARNRASSISALIWAIRPLIGRATMMVLAKQPEMAEQYELLSSPFALSISVVAHNLN